MKIIVIGCGRVGAGLAANLTLLGHDLTVVDHDPKAFARHGSTAQSCWRPALSRRTVSPR